MGDYGINSLAVLPMRNARAGALADEKPLPPFEDVVAVAIEKMAPKLPKF